jgi:hypothetical protein
MIVLIEDEIRRKYEPNLFFSAPGRISPAPIFNSSTGRYCRTRTSRRLVTAGHHTGIGGHVCGTGGMVAVMIDAEIQEQINEAKRVKLRFNYTQPIPVHKLWITKYKYVIGFNFKTDVNVGDMYQNYDGTWCQIVAMVN